MTSGLASIDYACSRRLERRVPEMAHYSTRTAEQEVGTAELEAAVPEIARQRRVAEYLRNADADELKALDLTFQKHMSHSQMSVDEHFASFVAAERAMTDHVAQMIADRQ